MLSPQGGSWLNLYVYISITQFRSAWSSYDLDVKVAGYIHVIKVDTVRLHPSDV